jgi:hypothetical protein
MTWLRNPWLSALVALAALGIHARVESPLAALAIGLPFALVMWGYWCFGPRMAATQGLMSTPPRQLFSKTNGSALLVALALLACAWFAYMCYGLVTERGIIGWLNAVQAAHDGKFSTKLSFIVALLYLFCAMGVLGVAGAWLSRGGGDTAPTAPPMPMPKPVAAAARAESPSQLQAATVRNNTRLAMWLFAAIAVGAWAIGYPVYLWVAAEHREDVQARYASVDLGGTRVSWPQDPHVALGGVPQGDQVLVLKEGNHARKTYFVPMTGTGWTPAQPVNVVLTFEAETAPQLDRPVLGRLRSDTLPLAAVQAFARSGVTIDASHRLVDLVPSLQGQVIDRSDSDRQTFLIGATLLSTIGGVGGLMFWLVMKFKRPPAKLARDPTGSRAPAP